jgi:hypothetical protein
MTIDTFEGLAKNSAKPLLTIMIPTTYDRRKEYARLLIELWRQILDGGFTDLVTIISDEDDKSISIGKKRQLLLEKATGTYVVGFDSDDWPSMNYVAVIVAALQRNSVDHIGFIEKCTINGEETRSIFSIRYNQWAENVDGWDHIRCANPKSVIVREKALQAGFEDMRYGEDRVFSEKVTPLLDSEIFINQELYFYNHTSTPHELRYGLDKQ